MWVRRRWSGLRAWLKTRTWRTLIPLAFGVMFSPCGCCIGVAFVRNTYVYWIEWTAEDREFNRNRRHEFSEGLPGTAHRLMTEMNEFTDPDAAVAANPRWYGKRFPSGEWVFGHGVDSHGFRVGGGTTVIKDSQGRVRVYFGHVCGENGPVETCADQATNLNDFDRRMVDFGTVREWKP